MELSERVQQVAWVGLLAYLGLYIYALSTGNQTALFVADAAFVLVMLLFSGFVYRRFGADSRGLLAAVLLAVAAVLEAVSLVTNVPGANQASSLLLIAGILLYIYLQRQLR